MKIRTLGVDLGIASIGWALIQEEGERLDIIDSGVRIFTKAEHPKDKSSLALPRRIARSARRSIRRKRARILQVKKFLASTLDIKLEGMLSDTQMLAALFDTRKDFLSPWQLRVEGLDRRLSDAELARVILHIAKRRGYDDLTYGIEDNEKGKVLKAVKQNQALLLKYRSVGEMMVQEFFQKPREGYIGQWENVRNHPEQGDYKRCVGRSELRAELKLILQTQAKLGNTKVTDSFVSMLLGDEQAQSKSQKEGLIFYQRPLKGFADKIGHCVHLPSQKRACKGAPSAEEFIAVSKIINTLLYISNQTGVQWELPVLIDQILSKAYELKSGVSYAKLREILQLPEAFEFRELTYSKEKVEQNTKFIELQATHKLLKANPTLPRHIQDEIAAILGANKDWETIQKLLANLNLTQEQISRICDAKLQFATHINLSLEALAKLLPLMKEGKRYDEAVGILQQRGEFVVPNICKKDSLPPLCELAKEDSYFDIPNPVVNRALSEFRKVVNALIAKYGKFHYFNLELTREVGQSKKERSEVERRQRENEALSVQALDQLKTLGMAENSKNLLKCKLWIQQNEYCLYSGKKIPSGALKDPNLVEVDHCFPLSRSLDDSQDNKILCFKTENQNKRNQTPYEYFQEGRWESYVKFVYQSKFSTKKKKKLVNKLFKDRECGDRASFLTRNLVDTGYIARVVSLYVKNYLDFEPIANKKEHLRIVSGSLTSALRSYWGLVDKNREHHLHHAQDAIIIACINPSTINKYSQFLKEKELGYKDSAHKAQKLSEAEYKTKLALRYPTKDFKNKVEESIQKIIVSHSVSHKVSGALHQETIRKREAYYATYGGEEGVKKAIAFGKIREINGGLVDNGEMVRVDIFRHKLQGGFYAVPIYTFDFAKGVLPNKAIVAGKKDGVIKDWLEMDENYEFCFSLSKNDCVKIQTKEMEEPIVAVYKKNRFCYRNNGF
ncbi:type II CRISPR RNA-guided endonuclease Cas9 [Helicobacter enhydrae]|uniref:type II CRISPR RNA-guided endonuclease Cas9 n=1 Tax=Helicobacter enhydrae TaxID=222136 RepID=UPI000AA8ADCE|nr:type II CRISPR RNA-guided endonuclease Cas9 [Helicobacter enhydrae]